MYVLTNYHVLLFVVYSWVGEMKCAFFSNKSVSILIMVHVFYIT